MAARDSSIYLFSYGTLKKLEPNSYQMSNEENGLAHYIGAGRTTEKYPLIVSTRFSLPFLLDQAGVGKHVQGEVYQVDHHMLSWLDWFEDHPDVYTRRQIPVTLEGKELGDIKECECWTYMLKRFPARLVEVKEHLENFTYREHAPCYVPEEDDVAQDNLYDALVAEVEYLLKDKKS